MLRNFNPRSRAREGVDISDGHGVTAAATGRKCSRLTHLRRTKSCLLGPTSMYRNFKVGAGHAQSVASLPPVALLAPSGRSESRTGCGHPGSKEKAADLPPNLFFALPGLPAEFNSILGRRAVNQSPEHAVEMRQTPKSAGICYLGDILV